MSLTTQTLHNLPHYNAIAPTLNAIPTYSAKLARLKKMMTTQKLEVEALKRRAGDAAHRRNDNRRRILERRREEAERDRGVLRARVVVAEEVKLKSTETDEGKKSKAETKPKDTAVVEDAGSQQEVEEGERDAEGKEVAEGEASPGSIAPSSRSETPSASRSSATIARVVKRRKKARAAEIQ